MKYLCFIIYFLWFHLRSRTFFLDKYPAISNLNPDPGIIEWRKLISVLKSGDCSDGRYVDRSVNLRSHVWWMIKSIWISQVHYNRLCLHVQKADVIEFNEQITWNRYESDVCPLLHFLWKKIVNKILKSVLQIEGQDTTFDFWLSKFFS